MAIITDPDNMTDSALDDASTNLFVDPAAQTIKLVPGVGGLDASDGATIKAIFSKIQELWHANAAGKNLASFPFPFENITDEFFELVAGWDWADATTRETIRNGGWLVRNTSGNVTEHWAGFKAIGDIFGTDQLYQALPGTPTDFAFPGAINQAIQVIDDPDGNGDYADGFDRSAPAGAIIYNREQGQLFSSAGLTDIGEANLLAPKVFSFAVGTAADLDIAASDATISTTAPWNAMTITYHTTPQSRDIGGANYDFGVIIDANGGTKQQVYEFIQYQLRQNADVDADADTKLGKLQSALLRFTGSNLATLAAENPDGGGTGVYVDGFDQTQINDWSFIDNLGTSRSFPFLAGLRLEFNDIAQSDATFKYFVYMTDPDAAPDGDEWGTAGGIILEDKDAVAITGLSAGAATVTATIDYDGSIQGGRTPGVDIPITVVGVGIKKNGAKHVVATGVISRQAVNTVALVPALNRQYENVV